MEIVVFISFTSRIIKGYDAWWAGVRPTLIGILELDNVDDMKVSSVESSEEDYDGDDVHFNMPPPPLVASTSTTLVDPSWGI